MFCFLYEKEKWYESPEKYKIVIGNDAVWVNDISKEECVYTFNSYGYQFIHTLLKDMGINVEMY